MFSEKSKKHADACRFCWMWMDIRSQMMKLLIREISCRE